MKKKLVILSSLGLSVLPFLALAQNSGGCSVPPASTPGTIQHLICIIGNILQTIVPVFIALAIVYFIWGIISYVMGQDEEAKKTGKNRMIWGIIGLVAIVSMWGLVSLLTTTFGLNNNVNVQIPAIDLY